jgi:hypothetical protein
MLILLFDYILAGKQESKYFQHQLAVGMMVFSLQGNLFLL